uniref:Putative secreted protein n=1 Tax=Anopheles darlingi TaxID=43151 RepID=A0A2M4DLM0_ANODA
MLVHPSSPSSSRPLFLSCPFAFSPSLFGVGVPGSQVENRVITRRIPNALLQLLVAWTVDRGQGWRGV